MSETQTQPTPDQLMPASNLPQLADMEAIHQAIAANIKYQEGLVATARDHLNFSSPQIWFRTLQLPFKMNDFPELTEHGLEWNWQYARLSAAKLADLVPNRQDRQFVERYMAQQYGLLVDTQFTEEMLRDLQGQPRNILVDKSRLNVVHMCIGAFVELHSAEFNEVTKSYLKQYWSQPVLRYMCSHRSFMNSTQVNVTSSKFGQALAKYGLWLGFTPTTEEQRSIEAWRNANLP